MPFDSNQIITNAARNQYFQPTINFIPSSSKTILTLLPLTISLLKIFSAKGLLNFSEITPRKGRAPKTGS